MNCFLEKIPIPSYILVKLTYVTYCYMWYNVCMTVLKNAF